MGRIRSIKPDFFLHEGLFDLEAETQLPIRLSFAGLWTQCDREGRFRWQPRKLKVTILPYDEIDFSRVLDALTTRDFVRKYEANGEFFGWIPGFATHQVINNREKASALPDPADSAALTPAPRDDDASSTREGRVPIGREGKGREQDIGDSPSGEPSPQKSKRSKPKKPITDDFTVTPELIAWAEEQGYAHINLCDETDRFVDYWKAKGEARADWRASWRTWIRNADKYQRQAAANGSHRDAVSAAIHGH